MFIVISLFLFKLLLWFQTYIISKHALKDIFHHILHEAKDHQCVAINISIPLKEAGVSISGNILLISSITLE